MRVRASYIGMLSLLAVLGGCSDTEKTQVKMLLKQAAPEATWDDGVSTTADITCDGQPDIVAVGHSADGVLVGVIEKSKLASAAPALVVRFPFGADPKAFCTTPKKIEHSPLVCSNEGGQLPGCRPIQGCSSVRLTADTCAPFNFYWDMDRNSLTWWR